MPAPAQALLETHRLRILSKQYGIARINASADSIHIQFIPNPPIDAGRIIALIQQKRHYKLSGPDKLKIEIATATLTERVNSIKALFKELT